MNDKTNHDLGNVAPHVTSDGQSYDFAIHNIYTKDISFESPNSPQVFAVAWEPKVDFDFQMSSNLLEENIWEVVLDVTVKVSVRVNDPEKDNKDNKDNKFALAFLVEVKQAGIFSILGLEDKDARDRLMATFIPSILFPYVREQISSLTSKGGFPQFILPPMNFEAMYKQHLQAKQEQTKKETEVKPDANKIPIISLEETEIDKNKH